jgi:outer membrane protein assembly factor BamB
MASAPPSSASPTGSLGTDAATASPAPSGEPSWSPTPPVGAVAALQPGSDPSALPGPILIADRNNNRILVVDPQGHVDWSWLRPGDLAPRQSFRVPDDAFFTPDGKGIVITQEDDFVITEVDIATRKIVWRYGVPGVHGASPGLLWNPDDAMLLPSGQIVAADIKNCRLLRVRPGTASPTWSAGQVGVCRHAPPLTYGSPNGAFPLPDGHFMVTEINGDWVDEIDASGRPYWSTRPPNVGYPSDSNQYKPGQYLTVDYSSPGQVVLFDQAGHTIWRWAPSSGTGRLNHPSLAQGLPNGDIVVNDDRDDRVIVIDPHTNRIVWQYGHTGVPGSRTGYLNNPDGIDPLPPHAYADSFGNTGG